MKKFYDTGIFLENTKLNETQAINDQLMGLYTAWFKHMKNNGLDEIGESNKFNGMHLLTCFDAYVNKKNKIMLYGKEANSQDGRIEIFDKNYQNDAYYTYDYAIVNPDKTSKKESYNRFFLKTRKIVSDIEDGETQTYDKVLSILNNNLNKTSFMGKYTPCFNNNPYKGKKQELYQLVNKMENIVYSEFEFNGIKRNIFIHELNILRPTHLVFLCGKGYNNHIKRDFGKKFYDNVNIANIINNSINVKETPVSKPVMLDKQQIQKIFGLEDYECFNLIFAIHPSAHMTVNIRNKYEVTLSDFINH